MKIGVFAMGTGRMAGGGLLKAVAAEADHCGKAGWPGPHNRHVVEAVGIDRTDEAETAGKRILAGIAQHLAAPRANDDRQLAAVDAKALDQRLRAGVGVRIEDLVRMPAAPEEIIQP